MKWWPFRKKPEEPEVKLTWVEILDARPKDPTWLQHELRMDWIYLNVPREKWHYVTEEDDFFDGKLRCYGFEDKRHAVMFKLTWGGSTV